MANSGNTERGQSVVARWRTLAERRLNHLIELYESGRWKLYYKEPDFLKTIQEARLALQTWEQLAPPDPAPHKTAEIATEQEANAAILPSPFTDSPSAHGVEAEDDLRKT